MTVVTVKENEGIKFIENNRERLRERG